MDFTLITYRKLLKTLKDQGYSFVTFAEFLTSPQPRTIVLRNDVEAKYENALTLAKIQCEFPVKGTFYFRFLPNYFDLNIIREITSLGHEIGYHYDDLSFCKGNYDAAIERFRKNLAILNEIAPVKTICMEGAPLSKYNNLDLWKKYNYRDFGIIGEPYLDIDFSKVMYLTETGRRWDGSSVSVRDKIDSSQFGVRTYRSEASTQLTTFHSTFNIINAAEHGRLPDQIMFTFHPQRWNDHWWPWTKELVLQNMKNVVKGMIVKRKS